MMLSINSLDYMEVHDIQQIEINWHHLIDKVNGASSAFPLDITYFAMWHFDSQVVTDWGTLVVESME